MNTQKKPTTSPGTKEVADAVTNKLLDEIIIGLAFFWLLGKIFG